MLLADPKTNIFSQGKLLRVEKISINYDVRNHHEKSETQVRRPSHDYPKSQCIFDDYFIFIENHKYIACLKLLETGSICFKSSKTNEHISWKIFEL